MLLNLLFDNTLHENLKRINKKLLLEGSPDYYILNNNNLKENRKSKKKFNLKFNILKIRKIK